jgi:hypothetical protein
MILIGFGAVFYLPFIVWRQSSAMKAYLIGSIIPFGILLFLGNLTEIRTFSEFVPAFAVLLANFMAQSVPQAPRHAASDH